MHQETNEDEQGKNEVKEQTVISQPDFYYPFSEEVKQINAILTIHTRTRLPEDMESMRTEIPSLKYNKSWLLLLTQDDCKHAAFCCTWAAFNGRPLSDSYFYDLAHIQAEDFPPDAYYLGKTLGCTDGAGNEVRFSFTTTLSPEWQYMNAATKVAKGYTNNYYRFFMKSGLVWGNVKEMLNYGTGIAFHDLRVDDSEKYNEAILSEHLDLAHEIVQDKLERDCKMLARPDGNNTYVNAGIKSAHIHTLTTESGGSKLYPDGRGELYKIPVERSFFNPAEGDMRSSQERIKETIGKELSKPENERAAICVGVHGTDRPWAEFFVWLNDEYGKEGADNMWMPSQEEYYEYACRRKQAQISLHRVDDYTLEVTIETPAVNGFYYPSLTVNLYGIDTEDITAIDTDDHITGFSYAYFKKKGCTMLNIDCRKYLAEHAENFVKRYEANPASASAQTDALYFVKMLKESDKKNELLKRIK